MLSILSRLIAAAWLIIAATAAAHADPIITPFLVTTFLISTEVASVITFALLTAASIGLSYLAKALAPKPSQPDISSLPGGTTGKLQTGGTVPRAFLVGRAMTAGSLVYANTYSSSAATAAATGLSLATAAAGNTPNAYLVQVIALSDIPLSALVSMFIGAAAATYNSGATPSFEGIPISEYNKDGKDYFWVRFYDGTQVAADPQLVALFGTDPDRPYTSARTGTGVAYVVVTSLVNQDLFPGFPQCKFVLDGVKFYDRRYDTSVGGSGSQRWSTPSTWALTKNNIVIAENVLRGISYGGKWVYGAQTVAAAQLPSASWTAAASECDVATDLAAGGTEPQFKAGGEIRFDVEPASTLEELLKACNGRLAEIGGTYKVRAGAAGSAIFSFTDGDILSTEQQTFDPFPSLGQTINAVTAKYVSPAEGWVAKDAPPLYDAALETVDGGRRQPVDINYSFVTSGTQVQRLMKAARDNHRAMRSHALPMPPEAFVLEPLDVVSWTSTRNGYVSKLFEVVSAEDLPNFNMGLALKELDPNAYDWVAGTDEQAVTDGTIVIVRPPSQPIVGWDALPWTILSDDNRHLPGIKLIWNADVVDVNGVRYEVRIKATAEVVTRGETDSWSSGSIIISHNLISNTLYQTRGQYRPVSFRDVTWSDWLDVTTPDVRTGTLASFDESLRNLVTTEFTRVNDQVTQITELIGAVTADQDAANWLDKTKAKILIASTAVVVENAAQVYADGAISDASVTITNAALASADAAIAAYDVTVQATYATPTNVATAKSEAISAAGASTTQAIAAYAITANATFATPANVSTAQSTAISTAASNATSAIASYDTTTTATTGHGITASVNANYTAVATINNHAAAAWTVKTTVNGYVAGIELLNGGSGTSVFTISADSFRVIYPTSAGGDGVVRTMFQVSNVSGSPRVTLAGDFYADGNVSARNMTAGSITAANAALDTASVRRAAIQDLAVDTLQIAGNAVIVPAISTASNSITGSVPACLTASLSFTAPAGTVVTVLALCSLQVGYPSGVTSNEYDLYLQYNDGSVQNVDRAIGTAVDYTLTLMGAISVTATGGTDTVFSQVNVTCNSSTVANRTLFLQTAKR